MNESRLRLPGLLLSLLAVALVGLILVLPLVALFAEALRQGFAASRAALQDPDALAAIWLTLIVVSLSVPVNTVCGVLAAWCLAKFDFPGRSLLLVLIELPLSVSPVVAGLVWVLLFGARGWFAPVLQAHDIHIVFAMPGIVLATIFVTFPFVARTVMPLMEAQGREAEEAAMLLGAGFWSTLRRVTLPDVRWALVSGVLLCTARALGEFGAVSVVSGHIRGETETIPLHIETLYDDYQTVAAFSMAALLAVLSLALVGVKSLLEWRHGGSVEVAR
jgi:sulfate/thiosulfate transport system permease protein